MESSLLFPSQELSWAVQKSLTDRLLPGLPHSRDMTDMIVPSRLTDETAASEGDLKESDLWGAEKALSGVLRECVLFDTGKAMSRTPAFDS